MCCRHRRHYRAEAPGRAHRTPGALDATNAAHHRQFGSNRLQAVGCLSNVAQVTLPSAATANGIATATTAAAPTIAAALTALSLISSSALLDPSATFRLHSNPTATRTIYLDFNGHHHHDHQDEQGPGEGPGPQPERSDPG